MAKTMMSAYSLVDLFHFMDSGRLAVPEFQRGYVWSKENARKLFDSVNRGLPIGMLIAVELDGIGLGEAPPEVSLFPARASADVAEMRRLWLIDGCQRLAALYNGLFVSKSPLDLLYDLREHEFIFADTSKGRDVILEMSSLFNSQKLMELQSNLVSNPDAERLLEELNGIRERFYSYQMPTMIVMGVAPTDLLEVFTRLNSTGIALTKKELDRISEYATANTARTVDQLSDAAKVLLKEGAQDRNGRIIRVRTMQGLDVQTNGKNFVESHNPRVEARWEGAVQQLTDFGIIEDRGHKGEVFAITEKGFNVADQLHDP